MLDIEVQVFVGLDEYPKFQKVCKRDGDKTISVHPKTDKCIAGRNYGSNLWFRKISKTPKGIGNIVHECVHAVKEIMNYMGLEDEEVKAYMTEYLVVQILKRKHE